MSSLRPTEILLWQGVAEDCHKEAIQPWKAFLLGPLRGERLHVSLPGNALVVSESILADTA